MAAILNPAARRINADVAGLTHVAEPQPGQPVGVVPQEVLHEAAHFEFGGLQHIFTETPSPTNIVETAVAQPTSSLVGRLGGLVPQLTTPQTPGPSAPMPMQAPTGYGGAPLPAGWGSGTLPGDLQLGTLPGGIEQSPAPVRPPAPLRQQAATGWIHLRRWLGF